MPDHKRTEELYKREAFPYPKPVDQLDQEQWFEKVINPNTGTFYQPSDLPAEHRHTTNKTYPVKYTIQMTRVQAADDREYLQSFQEWIAIDKLGNEKNMTFQAPETWYNVTFERAYIPKDRKNPDGPKELKVVGTTGRTKEYTLPFTTKNADSLYAMRRTKGPGSVSLSIKRVGLDGETIGQIYQVEKYDDFVSKKFEELWDYLSTPKYKLDRSYGDNLQGSHIK
jgi:hypothetical protein